MSDASGVWQDVVMYSSRMYGGPEKDFIATSGWYVPAWDRTGYFCVECKLNAFIQFGSWPISVSPIELHVIQSSEVIQIGVKWENDYEWRVRVRKKTLVAYFKIMVKLWSGNTQKREQNTGNIAMVPCADSVQCYWTPLWGLRFSRKSVLQGLASSVIWRHALGVRLPAIQRNLLFSSSR
jgi:hypothetical protein